MEDLKELHYALSVLIEYCDEQERTNKGCNGCALKHLKICNKNHKLLKLHLNNPEAPKFYF